MHANMTNETGMAAAVAGLCPRLGKLYRADGVDVAPEMERN